MLDSIPTAICRSASQPALVLWIQLAVGLESPNLDDSEIGHIRSDSELLTV